MPDKWNPAKHPRDKRGRFTKSRTVLASMGDYKVVKGILDRWKPATTGHGDAPRLGRPEHAETARHFALDAAAINADLRAGHVGVQGVKVMDDAMAELPEDLRLWRTVPLTQFGQIAPDDLWGMKVRDAGFFPAQLDKPAPAAGQVRMEIVVPKGSRAVVNPATGEVYLDRDSEMVISITEPNSGGGHDMFITLLPKAAVKPSSKLGGKPEPDPAKVNTPVSAPGDKPEGAGTFRADLMKLKVPELQAQMRERGLKPGRLRKSQMVDALVADEVGGSKPAAKTTPDLPKPKPEPPTDPAPKAEPPSKPAPPPAPAPPARVGRSFDERIAAAATDRKALDAATLSTLPRSRGNTDLTPERRQMLAAWKLGETSDIDYALHNGGDVSPVTAARIGTFDEIMRASPLTSDVVLYRAYPTAGDRFGAAARDDLTGVEFLEPTHMLTQTSGQNAEANAGPGLLMRILAPAGTGGVAVGAGQDPQVLLDRGHTFRVVNDSGRVKGKLRRVDVEVVPKTGNEPEPFRVVKTAETTPGTPLTAEQVAALPDTALGRGLASGITEVKVLAGGQVGDVRLVTFADGSQAVQKIAQTTFAGSTQKDLTDSEDLAGRLGRAIGAPVPEVIRTNPSEVFMEFVPDAKPGATVLNRYHNLVERAGQWETFIDSRDGRLLGILDLITDNGDRHDNNWLVRKDGTIVGIDHGLTWGRHQVSADPARKDPTFESAFAARLFGDRLAENRGWQANDLSAADIELLRSQVSALRPDFEAAGRGDWLDYSLARLEQIGEHAQGTENRVAA